MIFHKIIENKYKARLFTRYDDVGIVKYFSVDDFPGLTAKPYSITSSLGHTLQGYFYSYGGTDENRLTVFDHGLGGGHRSYMVEIEKLCSAGHVVFAYDHTGCMESGGDSTRGFAQWLHDLDDCLKALKEDDSVNTSNISVMGHSMGGFSTLNISALHPDVKRIVVLSGFISVEKIVEQTFSGILKVYRKNILGIEREANPEYVCYDAVETLKNSNAKALLIYSDNDPMVHKDVHYDALYSALGDRENVKFILLSGKGHNPNYTSNGVKLLGELSSRIKKEAKSLKDSEQKKAFRDSFDWVAITEQDEAVWREILDFLK